MKIGIDMDSTICTDRYESGGVLKCKLLPGAKEKLEELKKAGHEIVIFTHRSDELKKMTLQWLKENNIQHDGAIFNKPHFDVYIGDEARHFISWEEIVING